jgi:UDP-GlcNAc:undecaprenyl-phosphate GlcNAc-1-phosphate transferase
MNRLLFAVLMALLLTAFLCRVFRRPAERLGLVDVPGGRKQHEGNIPLVGGLAMFCGFALSAFSIGQVLSGYFSLIAAMGLLVTIGMADDMHDIKPGQKFMAQVLAALFMTSWAGLQVQQVGNLFGFGTVMLYLWAMPFTVVCVLGVINAVNMLDGVDGLAGSVCLVALGWFAAVAFMQGQTPPAWILVILCGAVAGYLLLNLRLPGRASARVFMGDAGSMMLGFALTWFCVELTQHQNNPLPPMAAVWIIAVPLFDMGHVMLSRVLRGQSMVEADRNHLHHILARQGWSANRIVAVEAGAGLLCGAIGVAAWQFHVPDYVLFYLFVAALALYSWAALHHTPEQVGSENPTT